MMKITPSTWDVFIAYARSNHDEAKQLHDRLARYVPVFMDTEVLRPGDDWDEITPRALQDSSVIVILLGHTLPDAHFLKSEIQRAISSSRRDPYSKRIVPVVLEDGTNGLPYGLERKHCLMWEPGNPSRVVEEVFGLLLQSSKRRLTNSSPSNHVSREVLALMTQLEGATSRLALLRESRAASAPVLASLEQEVESLRRQLRAGGQLHPGDVLSERYLLLEKLGSGGFAHVWLAIDRNAQAKVAVKVLRGELLTDAVAYDRFARGARAMASLDHPNICKILSTDGISKDGTTMQSDLSCDSSYYVMEYLAGGDLRTNVLAGKLSTEHILSLIIQCGQALTCAHNQDIIHRDIKPENILLTDSGDARLTDFDLAMLSSTTARSTAGGLGTFIYSAPEQQHLSKNVDKRVDVYSLGMTTVFALYGDLLPLDVVHNPALFIEELKTTTAVKEVLRRAVGWEPASRYRSVDDFCVELSNAWKTGDSNLGAQVKSLLIPEIDIELVYVPSGKMIMGDDSAEESRPPHLVYLPEFWIGRFPVTNSQYQEFCKRTGHEASAYGNNEKFNQPTQPVIGVNLGDAQAFCRWLEQILSNVRPAWWSPSVVVRLPSEAEWEYAARGPSSRTYPWGFEAPNDQLANHGNVNSATTSVGNYPEGASWVSAQDMAGNVWEWCEDYWHENYQEAPADGSAWVTGDSLKRVVRGGSFLFDKRGLAGHYRYWWHVDKRQGNQGFRVVVSGIKSPS